VKELSSRNSLTASIAFVRYQLQSEQIMHVNENWKNLYEAALKL
jgi:hypothetical protein